MGWHQRSQQNGFSQDALLGKERKLCTHETAHTVTILALDGLENGCQILLTGYPGHPASLPECVDMCL